jgi:hypothetical protein
MQLDGNKQPQQRILALSATGTRPACSFSIFSQTPFSPYKKEEDKTNSRKKRRLKLQVREPVSLKLNYP